MKKNTQHVVPHPDGWAVKKGGSTKATKTFDTQAEAIDFGREVSQNQQAELFIHRPNGQIRDRNSYGKDPFPPRG